MLGYFSLIGLLRIHSILGDPVTGLNALAPLNPHERKGLFATKIALSCINMYYYAAYAYLSLHRYLDAARCMNFVLNYISKVKSHQNQQRGHNYDQILNKNEQLYAMLAITTALCPAANRILEESVSNSLREKYGEKARLMTSGDVNTVEELFSYACPKFITTSQSPDWSNPASNVNAEAYRAQLQAFMSVVEQRKHLPAIKQFLKLYTSIPIIKLALLAEMDDAGVKQQLALMQETTQVMTWTPGCGGSLSGSLQPCGDIEFTVEKQDGVEMVLMKETRQKGVKGDFLVRHIQRLADISKDLDALAPPASVAEAVLVA
jgi:translation initiation factor 3 subunit L